MRRGSHSISSIDSTFSRISCACEAMLCTGQVVEVAAAHVRDPSLRHHLLHVLSAWGGAGDGDLPADPQALDLNGDGAAGTHGNPKPCTLSLMITLAHLTSLQAAHACFV